MFDISSDPSNSSSGFSRPLSSVYSPRSPDWIITGKRDIGVSTENPNGALHGVLPPAWPYWRCTWEAPWGSPPREVRPMGRLPSRRPRRGGRPTSDVPDHCTLPLPKPSSPSPPMVRSGRQRLLANKTKILVLDHIISGAK